MQHCFIVMIFFQKHDDIFNYSDRSKTVALPLDIRFLLESSVTETVFAFAREKVICTKAKCLPHALTSSDQSPVLRLS